jgi:hypothetical protein
MAVTEATVVFLATAVTLATPDLVVPAALAVMQRLEPTGLKDLADEPEVAALVETVETETHPQAQVPKVAMVETAATQEQQGQVASLLADSPATAETVVPAEQVGLALMDPTPYHL